MPDRIIARVNRIGAREKQGCTFHFLNWKAQPYEWTNKVPEDDPEFQGLLEEEEATPYPDLSTKPPGVELEHEEGKFTVITKEDEPDFWALAATALDNAGIDPDVRLRDATNQVGNVPESQDPALIEPDQDKVVYEITFDLPDAGLAPQQNNALPASADKLTTSSNVSLQDNSPPQRRYPQQSCRSVVGHEPYNLYAPRITFLQRGEIRACSSVQAAAELARMSKQERMHTTTSSQMDVEPEVDCTQHVIGPELVTESEDKMKVWGYLMTQYNLKPGLRKLGERGAGMARVKLTQLHIMDTWKAMDPSQILREERMKVLSSLLFLKEKRTGKIKGRACVNGAPQQAYIPKEEAASPTVSTELTFITAAIAASERRNVRCFNIPSAFVNTNVDEVLMILKGELVEMMVQIAPQVYRKYVTEDKKGHPYSMSSCRRHCTG